MKHLSIFLAMAARAQMAWTGAPMEDELKPGESRSYSVRIEKGLYFLATAAQLSGNVALHVKSPAGVEIAVQNRFEVGGMEDLPWVAPESGPYTFTVRSVRDSAARYRLELVTRNAGDKERSHVAAYRLGFLEIVPLLNATSAATARELSAKLDAAAIEANKAGVLSMEVAILNNAAVAAQRLGDLKKALALVERAVALSENLLDEPRERIDALSHFGQLISRSGQVKAAIPILERAVAMSREIKDPVREAKALANLASSYSRLADHANAWKYHEESLTASRVSGSKKEIALALGNLGTSYYNRGQMQKALEYYLESLRYRREAGDDRLTGTSLRLTGTVLSTLGEPVKAQEYFAQAEAIFRRLGDEANLANVLYALGSSKMTESDGPGAVANLEQSVALYRKNGDVVGMLLPLGHLTDMYANLGQWEKATASANEVVQRAGAAAMPALRSRALGVLARASAYERRFDDAARLFEEAIANARRVSDAAGEAKLLDDRSTFLRGRGQLHAALADIEKAMAIGIARADLVESPELRASARSLLARRSRRHVDLLMALHALEPGAGYGERAFLVAERDRARTLRELLTGGEPPRKPSEKEKELEAVVAAVQRDYFREGLPAARRVALQSALARAERDLESVRHTGSAASRSPLLEELDLATLRETLTREDGAVVVYLTGQTRSFAWVFTKEELLDFELPGKSELQPRVEALRKLLAAPANALTASRTIAAIDVEARGLTQRLIEPLAGALRGKQRIVIVPEGPLSYLPFELLGAPKRMLETHRITYAPSVAVAAALARKEPVRGTALLAMGDPALAAEAPTMAMAAHRERGFDFVPLPNARAEVAAIGRLFPGARVLLGRAASEEFAKGEPLGAFRYLHFAAHGYFDAERPERSGIVLAQRAGAAEDGFLQVREVARLGLNADLVTLSACQSGLGKVLDGEGVQGLSRAFFLAGARSVVVSLWNVNDAATSELMRRFYSGLKAGLAKDEALRAAKLAVMKETRWRHPYYWAPFVLQGDAGER